ncbi:phage protein [Streptococcus anginosus]|uniref:Phage protein n=1 Tax=Streptococcus anginosus TaxID=1328 RepID=A0A4V0AB33_STRAP|nr:virulence-associated E family protein [Streptococcus anginosus]VTS50649.1 phage protein [Streptococcus anginosus]
MAQLWGEAVAIYKKGFNLTFDDDFEDELAVYKEQFTYRDEAESQIYDYLDMLVPEDWDAMTVAQHISIRGAISIMERIETRQEMLMVGTELQGSVSAKQILKNVFDIDSARGERIARKIKLIMDNNIDFEYKIRKINGKSIRAYFRKNIQK